ARAGTTTIAIGKAVKQTVDTRFYPRVHVCTTYLSATGYIVPGQTEVRICDGSNHAVPDGSGYTVTLAGMSATGCTKGGGGVCPPDTVGKKADFTGLTGDDIAELAFNATPYYATDDVANVTFSAGRPAGLLAYYGELKTHFPYSPLGTGNSSRDIFHVSDAAAFCSRAAHESKYYGSYTFDDALNNGTTVGGATSASTSGVVKSLYIGNVTGAINTGGDTNPELFVSGGGSAVSSPIRGKQMTAEVDSNGVIGATLPRMLLLVNGKRQAATYWSFHSQGPEYGTDSSGYYTSVSIGHMIPFTTGWNLSDMYYVNNWPGTPLASHKPDKNDTTNHYVTQVNYVSGYVCEASLQ
ncbi:hypothetical protein NUM31_004976, partial [Salmonella enterica]|nr:hypothetical protein [Salmonella enterica]